MWWFRDEMDLAPTNNLAERCWRRSVLWRKGSFGTDRADGRRFVERIASVVAKRKVRRRNAFAYLVHAWRSHAAGQSVPSVQPRPGLPT